MAKLVSVVTIFLNAERFIEDAIQSVLAQTYHDWELLLVDDGSVDRSAEIAKQNAAQSPETVRYLHHDNLRNRGMSASRNLGIRHARGAYVAFLDADDVWRPDKLRQQVAILESHPEAAMVYGVSQRWYSWTGDPEDAGRDYTPRPGLPSDAVVEPPTLLRLFLQKEVSTPGTCSVIARREVIEQVGGFEEEFPGMYEDQAFYAKVCLEAPVYVSTECWDRYRRHPGSCRVTVKRDGQYHLARLKYLRWLREYLLARGAEDPGVWRALDAEIWRSRHPLLISRMGRAGDLAGRALRMIPKIVNSSAANRPTAGLKGLPK